MEVIVCCCDHKDCTALRWMRREQVLETLSGLCVHEHVVDACVHIQAGFRGFRFRRDKRVFDAAVALFMMRWRRCMSAHRAIVRERSVLRIQCGFRGWQERRTRFGRLLSLYMKERRRVRALRERMVQVNLHTHSKCEKNTHKKTARHQRNGRYNHDLRSDVSMCRASSFVERKRMALSP